MPERPRPQACSNGEGPGVMRGGCFLPALTSPGLRGKASAVSWDSANFSPTVEKAPSLSEPNREARTRTRTIPLCPALGCCFTSHNPGASTSAAAASVPPRGALTPQVGRRDTRGSRRRSRETGPIAPAVGFPEDLHTQLSPPSTAEAPPTSGET